jgi:hypothetical protein
MDYKYKFYGDGVYRPIVRVSLFHQDKGFDYELLVDSGADMCMFGMEVGLFLGIDFSRSKKGTVAGVGGEPMTYYCAPVRLEVAGASFIVEAGFLSRVSQFDYGVAGRQGFFDQFLVTFNEPNKFVQLQPVCFDLLESF